MKIIYNKWIRIGPPGQRGIYDPSLDEISVGPEGPQGDVGEPGERGTSLQTFFE